MVNKSAHVIAEFNTADLPTRLTWSELLHPRMLSGYLRLCLRRLVFNSGFWFLCVPLLVLNVVNIGYVKEQVDPEMCAELSVYSYFAEWEAENWQFGFWLAEKYRSGELADSYRDALSDAEGTMTLMDGSLLRDWNTAVLILLLWYAFILLIQLKRFMFSALNSNGFGYADVLRITRRGILMVGRSNGYRWYVRWGDFRKVNVRNDGIGLYHKNRRMGGFSLPLPRMEKEEFERFAAAVKEAHQAAAGQAVQPPAHALEWQGLKLTSRTNERYVWSPTLLNKLAVACAVLLGGAGVLVVMGGGGYPIATALATLIMLSRGVVLIFAYYKRSWYCRYRADRAVIYAPAVGTVSFPISLARDIFCVDKQPMLRLSDDAVYFPTAGAEKEPPLSELPRAELSSRTWILWIHTFVLFVSFLVIVLLCLPW